MRISDGFLVNLGRWVLTNLFRRFLEYEVHHRRSIRQAHTHTQAQAHSQTHAHHIPLDDLAFQPRSSHFNLSSPGIMTALPTPAPTPMPMTPKVPVSHHSVSGSGLVPGKDGVPHLPTIPQSPGRKLAPLAIPTSPSATVTATMTATTGGGPPSASAVPISPVTNTNTNTDTPKAQSPVEGGDYFSPRAQSSRKPSSPGPGTGAGPGSTQADDFGSFGPANKDRGDKDLATPGGFITRLKWRSAKTLKTPGGSSVNEKGSDTEGEVKVWFIQAAVEWNSQMID